MNGLKVIRLMIGAGVLLSAAVSGASAQEGVEMKNILGAIGIIPKDPPQIDYRERAPLVLPPKMELRTPANPASVEQIANWPKDPDVIAARKAAEEARTPAGRREIDRLSEGRRLSIEEIRAGRNPAVRTTTVDAAANDRRSDKSRMEPDELRAFDKREAKLSGKGIERKYLSDPPGDLLKAADGAPLKATVDPVRMGNPDSPQAFIEQQRRR